MVTRLVFKEADWEETHTHRERIPIASPLPIDRYSVVIVSGVVTTIGGRRNVTIKLTANNVTAANSISAEMGRMFHAQDA
jgi:hypothetical protein